ncbi:MAG: LOG family protein, partial [Bacteroidetes bacterium]|nr:LOG family protein [Bacteroidota bacterium]
MFLQCELKKSTAFYYFFTRKVMLTAPADAFVFFPGGFGTMDEFFEVVDMIELRKMAKVPIILIDK